MRWKTILTNDLRRLAQLEGRDQASQLRCAMKEQEIGLHCYQAEETLTDAELALLKRVLHLSELRWRVYKSKLWPHPSSPISIKSSTRLVTGKRGSQRHAALWRVAARGVLR